MKSDLTIAAERREALANRIKTFDPYAKQPDPPVKIEASEDGKRLEFLIGNQGKVVSAPPVWRWAIGWPWLEMLKQLRSRGIDANTVPAREEAKA